MLPRYSEISNEDAFFRRFGVGGGIFTPFMSVVMLKRIKKMAIFLITLAGGQVRKKCFADKFKGTSLRAVNSTLVGWVQLDYRAID